MGGGGVEMSLIGMLSSVLGCLFRFLVAVHLLLRLVVVWVSSFSVTEVNGVVGDVCDAYHCLP